MLDDHLHDFNFYLTLLRNGFHVLHSVDLLNHLFNDHVFLSGIIKCHRISVHQQGHIV